MGIDGARLIARGSFSFVIAATSVPHLKFDIDEQRGGTVRIAAEVSEVGVYVLGLAKNGCSKITERLGRRSGFSYIPIRNFQVVTNTVTCKIS